MLKAPYLGPGLALAGAAVALTFSVSLNERLSVLESTVALRGVVQVRLCDERGAARASAPYALYSYARSRPDALSVVAAIEEGSRSGDLLLRVGDGVVSADAVRVTPSLFALLGTSASLGTDLTQATSREAVISDSFWRRHFLSRVDVIGGVLTAVEAEPVEVVGVLQASVTLDYQLDASHGRLSPDIFLALPATTPARLRGFRVLGRLADGVPVKTAEALLNVDAPLRDSVCLRALTETSEVRRARDLVRLSLTCAWVLASLAILTSLGSMTVHVLRRSSEVQIRHALGASQWRLALSFAVGYLGSASLALAVGAAASLLALDWTRLRVPTGLSTVQLGPAAVPSVAVLALVAVVAGFAIGLLGYLVVGRLLRASRGLFEGMRSSRRLLLVLVALQLAFVVSLSGVAHSVVGGLRDLGAPRGLTGPERLFYAQLRLPRSANLSALSELLARVVESPLVEEAAAATGAPYSPGSFLLSLDDAERGAVEISVVAMEGRYFSALGRPVQGRAMPTQGEVILESNTEFTADVAQSHRWLGSGENRLNVVGYTPSLRDDGQLRGYVAMRDFPTYRPLIVIRARQEATAIEGIRRALSDGLEELLPDAAIMRIDSAAILRGNELRRHRAWVSALLAASAIGLVLLVGSVAAVASFTAQSRALEWALRLALGATVSENRSVARRELLRWLVPGGALGVGLSFVLARLLAGLVVELDFPGQWWAHLLLLPVCLLAVAFGSEVVFRRAMTVQPAAMLRCQGLD